jgi:hypothetical protein
MSETDKQKLSDAPHFEDKGQIRVFDLPGAITPGEAMLALQPKDVAFEDQSRSPESMLREANLNRQESESFIATRGLIGRWNTAEIMLRAWVEPIKWKGSDQFRSHLGIPLVAEQFYSIHSVVNQTLFGGYQVFKLDATSGTPIGAAEAEQALITNELKTCGYKGVSMKTEMREVTYDGLFYGFGVAHYGWETITKQVIKKVAKNPPKTTVVGGQTIIIPDASEDEVEEKCIGTVECNMPKFEHVPIRRFRYSPDLRRGDPRVAEWCGRIFYVTGYRLDALRKTEGWDIPTRDELVRLTTPNMMDTPTTNPLETQGSNTANPIFQQTTTPQKAYPEEYTARTSHDPLARKFEIFDYWTGFRHAVILNSQKAILNETHQFKRPPFLGFCFRNAPDSAHGYGIAFWLTDFQRVCQGIINAYLDDVNLNLMGTYTSPAGANNSAQAQWIFPGKVFKSDPQGKIEPLTRNGIDAKEPLTVIEQMKTWAASVSGAGPGVLGSNPGAAGDMRTPGGVAAITGGESVKMQDLIDVISEQVFVPFIEFCLEQNQKLKPSQIRAMLSEELGQALKATPIDILNGTYRVEISAGTKLAAREALNKYIGILETFLQSPGTVEGLAGQAMKIDYNGMFSALFDTYGVPYKEKIVVPMNDEDKQYRAAQTKAAQAQGKIAGIQAQGEVKKDVDNNQAENRMLLETGKHALKTGQAEQDHSHDLELQQKQKEFEQTPEAQGLDRAAKSAFAKQDSAAFSGS